MDSLMAKDLVYDFGKKNYKKVCKEGLKKYYGGKEDEMFVAMVGLSCAEVDNINPLGFLQKKLVQSLSARETASYFSSLVLQKRLLYQFMIDDIDMSNLSLPLSEHILSKIFEKISHNEYEIIINSPKMIKIELESKTLMISISDDEVIKILVDEYVDGDLKIRHWYQ